MFFFFAESGENSFWEIEIFALGWGTLTKNSIPRVGKLHFKKCKKVNPRGYARYPPPPPPRGTNQWLVHNTWLYNNIIHHVHVVLHNAVTFMSLWTPLDLNRSRHTYMYQALLINPGVCWEFHHKFWSRNLGIGLYNEFQLLKNRNKEKRPCIYNVFPLCDILQILYEWLKLWQHGNIVRRSWNLHDT